MVEISYILAEIEKPVNNIGKIGVYLIEMISMHPVFKSQSLPSENYIKVLFKESSVVSDHGIFGQRERMVDWTIQGCCQKGLL